MTAPPDATTEDAQVTSLTALIGAQADIRTRVGAQLHGTARRAVEGFSGWYDTTAITGWAADLAAQAEAAQRLLAQTTDAYLARALSIITGRTVRPVGAVDVSSLRNGVTHAGAYARAADAYRWQQSQWDAAATALLTSPNPEPLTLVPPLDFAAERAATVADLDTQLAARAQSQASMTASANRGVTTGYRRVIHPELSTSGTCGLCLAASDRIYKPRQLMPIHAGCHCTTLPVIDRQDPGSSLNRTDLNRIYKEAGATNAAKLKAVRYKIDEHGELGPVLNRAGAPFRTANQARRDNNTAATAKTASQKRAEMKKLRATLTPALDQARTLAGQDPAKWGDYLHAMETRIAQLDRDIAA